MRRDTAAPTLSSQAEIAKLIIQSTNPARSLRVQSPGRDQTLFLKYVAHQGIKLDATKSLPMS